MYNLLGSVHKPHECSDILSPENHGHVAFGIGRSFGSGGHGGTRHAGLHIVRAILALLALFIEGAGALVALEVIIVHFVNVRLEELIGAVPLKEPVGQLFPTFLAAKFGGLFLGHERGSEPLYD